MTLSRIIGRETDCVRGPSTMPTTSMRQFAGNWIPWASWCFVPGKRMYRRSSKVPGHVPMHKIKNMERQIEKCHDAPFLYAPVLWSPTLLRIRLIILPPYRSGSDWLAGRTMLCYVTPKSILPCRIKEDVRVGVSHTRLPSGSTGSRQCIEQSPLRVPLERPVRLVSRSGTAQGYFRAGHHRRSILYDVRTLICAMRLSRDLKKKRP